MIIAVLPSNQQTTSATPLVMDVLKVKEDSTGILDLYVLARSSDGIRAGWRVIRSLARDSGNASFVGAGLAVIADKQSGAATWTAVIGLSVSTLQLTVSGAADKTITWAVMGNFFVDY